MSIDVLAEWVRTHVYSLAVTGVLAGVLAAVLLRRRKAAARTPAAVFVAAFGALVCTAYSGDTSWRFARDHLGMASSSERIMMFAAGEIALFAMALMARANLNDSDKNEPGTPGVLVWVVTGVQVIPAYSESGMVAGTVRAFFGPIAAALLWHLAMGIEVRHRVGSDSQALTAVLAREARQRLLSRLGLATRGRDAAQITRDRWTLIATRRAAHLAYLEGAKARAWRKRRAQRRLAAAVDRTDAGVMPEQREVLMGRIAAYRNAVDLASVKLPSPWQTTVDDTTVDLARVPEPVPDAPAALAPAAPRPVPEVVPAGVQTLTIMPKPKPRPALTPAPRPLAAEQPRPQVHEYVPEDEDDGPDPEDQVTDDSPPPPGEDTLTAQARIDFKDAFDKGTVPTYRALKTRYRIRQSRAGRIRNEFLKVPA